MSSDISKLRPELLEISDAEFQRRKDEIFLAEMERGKRAAVAEKEELAAKANVHIEAVVAGVKFLHEAGILPEKVSGAFSRSDGMFVPATVLRNVTAEQLAGGPRKKAAGPKRTRRVRDAAGNLVPSKASR